MKGTGIVTLRLHKGLEETTLRLHVLHVPTFEQTLVSLGCINRRGGAVFNLNKAGVPTLTKAGHTSADLKTTQNGIFLVFGPVVSPGEESDVKDVAENQALSVGMDPRLGHLGLTLMNSMPRKGMISRLMSDETDVVSKREVCC